ncbi:hypothetical protein KIN20_002564 [Parelaphostrongylus tenuis]|uniref:Uncharacterized protein n=1 Tax=Parelaphostrongylus tenuis TaxID=148309 RepID=A0AAD5MEE4_PARTN|nr:hypothetical protein KIN20_002564 [Parelaphostrongylus tenuis]
MQQNSQASLRLLLQNTWSNVEEERKFIEKRSITKIVEMMSVDAKIIAFFEPQVGNESYSRRNTTSDFHWTPAEKVAGIARCRSA